MMQQITQPTAARIWVGIFSFLLLFATTACQYFRVKQVDNDKLQELLTAENKFNVFYLHADDAVYHLQIQTLGEESIVGSLSTDPEPIYHEGRKKKLVRSGENRILHEVHLYLYEDTGFSPDLDVESDIPLRSISKIEVIDPDSGKTIGAVIVSLVGFVALLAIIVALTKSSCPYIYAYDNGAPQFVGEIFGGAVLQNLERADFLPIPEISPDGNGHYRLAIANELKERQYINLAELPAVHHPEGTKVLFDQKGVPHLITEAVAPLEARSALGVDLSAVVEKKDRQLFVFGEPEARHNSANLTFQRPAGAQKAKLLLNAHNTFWFDGLYGRFMEKFGVIYASWNERMAQKSREERWQQQIEQDFPLSIYLQTEEGWQLVEHLPTVGPMAERDMVVPIDLKQLTGDEVTIRIQTGFLFWQLDYAAMDFSENGDLEVEKLSLEGAINESGLDISEAISLDDDHYLQQLRTGDRTELYFSATPVPEGKTRSLFLHAKGYYEHVREFHGLQDFVELRQFLIPGRFDQFSKQTFLEVVPDTGNKQAGTFPAYAEPSIIR